MDFGVVFSSSFFSDLGQVLTVSRSSVDLKVFRVGPGVRCQV